MVALLSSNNPPSQMVSSPAINSQKYSQAVLAFLDECNNRYLGKTKLNKLMYYLDFISYRDRQESVTNDSYIHKDLGPVPSEIDNVLADLVQQGFIKAEREPSQSEEGIERWKFEALTAPNMQVFDSYEKHLIKNICNEFKDWDTQKIVAQTHLEAPWFYSKPYSRVDYKYASDIEFFQPELNEQFQMAGQENG